MEKATIILGLGSNIGNRLETLQKACQLLHNHGIRFIQSASIYESEAWGFETTQTFYNTVIQCETTLNTFEVLETTQAIEKTLGRTTKSHLGNYSSRTIDIDIVFFNNLVINSEKLTIPHPLFSKRNFVLTPLNELIPSYIDPRTNLPIATLAKNSNDASKVFVVHNPIFVN